MLARALRPMVVAAPQALRLPPRGRALAAAAAAGGRTDRGSRYAGIRQPGSSSPQPADAAAHHPPSPHSGAGAAPAEPAVLANRRWLLSIVPAQQFKAVGVSFDDRQPLIAALAKDQAVVCVREPDNPHDPHAVALRTLAGASLGYIPRDKTHHFLQDLCFGAVKSVGQAAAREEAPNTGGAGLWGFSIIVQPSIPPVEVHTWPASLRSHLGGLVGQLHGDEWRALQAAVVARAQGRCELTAAPLGGGGGGVAARWAVDDAARLVRLAGFRLEAPEVQQIGSLLDLPPGSAAAASAAQLLARLNCWREADAQEYLTAVQEQAAAREAGGPWRLDLSLLGAHGVDVPAALQPLCVA